ncbi:recombinase family protein [Phenylobacterium sp.]|uniref:recombinase family protein n=1 Tax=Phenylobacterium sp. TaxID=1871053 RepID=UPI0025FE864E|nr:recombinase family protein [Phenylobacterium sp.]
MPATPSRRAAQYVRMSTDNQRYSIAYQTSANASFALEHGFEVVKSYEDAGISGLGLRRRSGLQQLLRDVLGGTPAFEAVLVYDVSRWGRFQDTDESAHYEFLCRSAGVEVIYTAEPFSNDGSLASALVKHLKRAMAAEFSRELSVKVSRTKLGIAGQGYWVGGRAPFGLVRTMVAPDGQVRGVLQAGQRKDIKGHRVVLTPGPPHEVALVRRIFQMFSRGLISTREIARLLNAEGAFDSDRPWTTLRVRLLLKNEAYAGAVVIGKSTYRLGEVTRRSPADWVRVPDAFEPIVSPGLFAAAQRRFRVSHGDATDAELLAELRAALRRHGRLSAAIIDGDRDCHCTEIFRRRFGSLLHAYQAIGYQLQPWHAAMCANALKRLPPDNRRRLRYQDDEDLLEGLRALLAREGRISTMMIHDTPGLPHVVTLKRRFGSLANLYARLGYEPSALQRVHLGRTNSERRAGRVRIQDILPA